MKLTEDACFAHDIGLLIKCDNWEEMEKQILDDYEKARKYDEIKNHKINQISFSNVLQNQKLRELLERKIKKLERRAEEHHGVGKWYLNEWKKILEDSKK